MKNYLLPFIATVLLALLLSSCSSKSYTLFQDGADYEDTNQNITTNMSFENKIAPKDRLSIEVVNIYNQANFGLAPNQTNTTSSSLMNSKSGFLVGSDGRVFLPLLGYVYLENLTAPEASERLTLSYKKYLKQPFVKVSILNQRIYVLGEVKTPGMIPVLNETMTIFEAIARSGDFTDYAKRDSIKIISSNTKNAKIRNIDMTSMSMLSNSNIILKPNDIVYVQPRDMKGFNVGVKETLPILQAISSALSPFATIKYLEN